MSATDAHITDHEQAQIDRANASTSTPAVFVHGLWLLPSSWERWAALFEEAGYVAVTPGWPDDPLTVEEAKANPPRRIPRSSPARASARSPTTTSSSSA